MKLGIDVHKPRQYFLASNREDRQELKAQTGAPHGKVITIRVGLGFWFVFIKHDKVLTCVLA